MNILENLEQLNVSEECYNDIMEIVEEYINEVSIKRWKEAAKNSIERRKSKDDALNDVPIGAYLSGSISKKYADKALRAMDRAARAKLLAEILPDSKKSAAKLKQAAKNSVEPRSAQSDKDTEKLKQDIEKIKSEREENKLSDETINKANADKQKYDKSLFDREDKARVLANKTLRRSNPLKNRNLEETPGAYVNKVYKD